MEEESGRKIKLYEGGLAGKRFFHCRGTFSLVIPATSCQPVFIICVVLLLLEGETLF